MKNNTVVTAGDINFLWGIFMLIASMRKSGMDEPVLVGAYQFTPEAESILKQFDDVAIYPLKGIDHSLTCYKPLLMLNTDTEYVSWVDGDGFFVGNCSKRLPPLSEGEVHIRMREAQENTMVFRDYGFKGDNRSVPEEVLKVWKSDIEGASEPRIPRSCVACTVAFHRSARPFLQIWHDQMMRVLPAGNVGVVDRQLRFYPQLDESVLNSLLCFCPSAPRVSDSYRLDKDRSELFCHFGGLPKPWIGWTPLSWRHFDAYTAVAAWAVEQGFKLPGPLPYSLKASNKALCNLLQHPILLKTKIRKRLKEWTR